MLRTKYMFAPREFDDGERVSIAFAHSWSEGQAPCDKTSVPDYLFNSWLSKLAPSRKESLAWYAHQMTRGEFDELYLCRLGRLLLDPKIKAHIHDALNRNITLLGLSPHPNDCYRKILGEEIARRNPNLEFSFR